MINTKNKEDFYWYALNISNKNIDKIINDINALNTHRIKKIINLTEMFAQSKIKTRVIFLNILLSKKLKQALLEIEGIKFFIPNNNNPYTFNDLNQFLKYHFNKQDIKKIEQSYLHEHESTKYSILQPKPVYHPEYQIGNMVLINNGIFKNHYAVITNVEENELKIEIQMENSTTNITTTIPISDTELIKKQNE